MEKAAVSNLVSRRQYPELEERADEYIRSDDWKGFLNQIKSTPSTGKARDVVVNLLQLDMVGGTNGGVS